MNTFRFKKKYMFFWINKLMFFELVEAAQGTGVERGVVPAGGEHSWRAVRRSRLNINPDELDICTSVISSCLHEWHFSGTLDFAKSVCIREIMIIISKLYFICKLYSEKNVQLHL